MSTLTSGVIGGRQCAVEIALLAFTGQQPIPQKLWAIQCDNCGRQLTWSGGADFSTGHLLHDTCPDSVNTPTFPSKSAADEAARIAGWRVRGWFRKRATCPICLEVTA